MDAIEVLGPKLVAVLALVAIGYFMLSLAPVWWPAIVAWRTRPTLPRRAMFVGVVAALVYGVFFFLACAILVPLEVYGIYVAPHLEQAGAATGEPILRASRFAVEYWWVLVPLAQLALTGYVTRRLKARWAHICATPAAGPSEPAPRRGAA